MDFKIYYSIILCTLITASCNERLDEPIKPSYYTGETTFIINQDSVQYCTYGKPGKSNGRNGIYIISDLIQGYIQTKSFAIFIPGESGVFPFHEEVNFEKGHARANFFYKDADVILASYYTPEDKANGMVSISQYNMQSGVISGDFECTLYLNRNYGLSYAPDSLVIRNGHFETTVVE